MNDAELLGRCPDYISIGGIFKATPHTEGEDRFVYFEASNEGLDLQGEVIVAKALRESGDYFLKYGNIDLDHITKIGPKLGIPDYQTFEIGIPREVRQTGNSTFVKSEIYRGTGPASAKANEFWDSITNLNPPKPWYPSVGGAALEKSIEIDPKTHARRAIIKKVRWSNVGMSRTPVNQHVGTCATVPVGAFAKSMGPAGLDIGKALEAGYGTDAATLTGGGALRTQSLEGKPVNYFDFRNKLSSALRKGHAGKNPSVRDVVTFASDHFGLTPDEAADHVERFTRDIKAAMGQRSAK